MLTLNGTSGDVSTFTTTSQGQLPSLRRGPSTLTSVVGSSTYLYVLGGEAGGVSLSTVYKATLNNTSGDVSTFTTTSQAQLKESVSIFSSVNVTVGTSTYFYTFGGCTDGVGCSAANIRSTVYKSLLNKGYERVRSSSISPDATVFADTFATTAQGQLLATRERHTSVTSTIGSSTYVYVLGGCQSSCASVFSTVYKATLNGNTGDVSTFDTTSQGQLLETLNNFSTDTSTFGSSTYVYVLGGATSGGGSRSTVYKATLNSTTGDVSTFATTSQGQLLGTLNFHTTVISPLIGSSTYVYVMGGCRNCNPEFSTVYKATLNSTTGDVSTFATTSQGQLPQTLNENSAAKATIDSTTYIYVVGGKTTQSTVYKATLNGTTGDVSTFATTSQGQLPQVLNGHSLVNVSIGTSTYLYVLGGNSGGGISTVYKATLNGTSGDVSTFATTSQMQLPQVIQYTAATVSTIGNRTYLYVIAGAGGVNQSTVYKSELVPGAEYDTQIQNATVNNSTLIIQISNLSIPERLLALIPFGLILPKLIQRFKIYDLRFMNIKKRLLEKLRKARRNKHHDPLLRYPLR